MTIKRRNKDSEDESSKKPKISVFKDGGRVLISNIRLRDNYKEKVYDILLGDESLEQIFNRVKESDSQNELKAFIRAVHDLGGENPTYPNGVGELVSTYSKRSILRIGEIKDKGILKSIREVAKIEVDKIKEQRANTANERPHTDSDLSDYKSDEEVDKPPPNDDELSDYKSDEEISTKKQTEEQEEIITQEEVQLDNLDKTQEEVEDQAIDNVTEEPQMDNDQEITMEPQIESGQEGNIETQTEDVQEEVQDVQEEQTVEGGEGQTVEGEEVEEEKEQDEPLQPAISEDLIRQANELYDLMELDVNDIDIEELDALDNDIENETFAMTESNDYTMKVMSEYADMYSNDSMDKRIAELTAIDFEKFQTDYDTFKKDLDSVITPMDVVDLVEDEVDEEFTQEDIIEQQQYQDQTVEQDHVNGNVQPQEQIVYQDESKEEPNIENIPTQKEEVKQLSKSTIRLKNEAKRDYLILKLQRHVDKLQKGLKEKYLNENREMSEFTTASYYYGVINKFKEKINEFDSYIDEVEYDKNVTHIYNYMSISMTDVLSTMTKEEAFTLIMAQISNGVFSLNKSYNSKITSEILKAKRQQIDEARKIKKRKEIEKENDYKEKLEEFQYKRKAAELSYISDMRVRNAKKIQERLRVERADKRFLFPSVKDNDTFNLILFKRDSDGLPIIDRNTGAPIIEEMTSITRNDSERLLKQKAIVDAQNSDSNVYFPIHGKACKTYFSKSEFKYLGRKVNTKGQLRIGLVESDSKSVAFKKIKSILRMISSAVDVDTPKSTLNSPIGFMHKELYELETIRDAYVKFTNQTNYNYSYDELLEMGGEEEEEQDKFANIKDEIDKLTLAQLLDYLNKDSANEQPTFEEEPPNMNPPGEFSGIGQGDDNQQIIDEQTREEQQREGFTQEEHTELELSNPADLPNYDILNTSQEGVHGYGSNHTSTNNISLNPIFPQPEQNTIRGSAFEIDINGGFNF